jgi:UDP-N-acetylmuramoylalanine--D-glutamate ligase
LSTPAGRGALPERSFLVYGLGVTNIAVVRALLEHERQVVIADDSTPDASAAVGAELGVPVRHRPDARTLADLLATVDAVIPAPGLPEAHPVFAEARRAAVPVLSEFDLAGAWDDRPVLAITGTNGKTTVTMLVAEMLARSSVEAAAVGNLETPLVAAIADPRPRRFVVEASSFRLARSRFFSPAVATWLNFAEDHLDVHTTVEDYRRAKARIWADQGSSAVAVVNAEDPVVAAAAPTGTDGPTVVRFGLAPIVAGAPTDFHERGGSLVGPDGEELVAVEQRWSQLPHDRSNALAASATALHGGATIDGVREALRSFRGLSHRVELVLEANGVSWYDDSKATAPHATVAAVSGFDSVVLIAGGRNKGLDLGALRRVASRVRAVVAIGEAADDVLDAFAGRPAQRADSMSDAVAAAAAIARPGDAVLLSPACASFDWYGSYAERGDDFAANVRELVSGVRPGGPGTTARHAGPPVGRGKEQRETA